MGQFAEELRAGIDEAARKTAEASRDGDAGGAEAWRERLLFLRRVAGRHGLGPWPHTEPSAGPGQPVANSPLPRDRESGSMVRAAG
jgi:hypothetical protein